MDRDPEQGRHPVRADLQRRRGVRRPAGAAPRRRRPTVEHPKLGRKKILANAARAVAHAGARWRRRRRRSASTPTRCCASSSTTRRRSRNYAKEESSDERKILAAGLALVAASAFAQYPNKADHHGRRLRARRRHRYRLAHRRRGRWASSSASRCWSRTAPAPAATSRPTSWPSAAPDGYTICLANVGAIAVNPHIAAAPYDPLKDLAPITMAVVFAERGGGAASRAGEHARRVRQARAARSPANTPTAPPASAARATSPASC